MSMINGLMVQLARTSLAYIQWLNYCNSHCITQIRLSQLTPISRLLTRILMSSVSKFDPSAWELVKYSGVFSFCAGSCRVEFCFELSHSVFDHGLAVASSAAVMYDWGEQHNTYRRHYRSESSFSSVDVRTRGRLMTIPSHVPLIARQ
jgi:hypothetical protein